MESELDAVLAQVNAILKTVESPQYTVRPTLLYEEGWLLRLVLSSAFTGIGCLPSGVHPGARWFFEALLHCAFRSKKHGDTVARAVLTPIARWGTSVPPFHEDGLALCRDARQFVVVETKVYSRLSRGTIPASGHDQAARTVACMAETLKRAGRELSEYDSRVLRLRARETDSPGCSRVRCAGSS